MKLSDFCFISCTELSDFCGICFLSCTSLLLLLGIIGSEIFRNTVGVDFDPRMVALLCLTVPSTRVAGKRFTHIGDLDAWSGLIFVPAPSVLLNPKDKSFGCLQPFWSSSSRPLTPGLKCISTRYLCSECSGWEKSS